MTRAVESVLHIFASVSPFLMTFLTKPSGSRGVLGAGVAAGAGATAEVGGDAVWISSAYPGSEQAKRNKTVMWQTGLFADRRVFTAAENILFMQ